MSKNSPVDLKLFTIDSIAPYCFLYLSRDFSIEISNSSNSILVTIGAFTLGMQKLLPALQRVYGSWTLIKKFNFDIENTLKNLELQVPDRRSRVITPIKFQNSINFQKYM